MLTLEEIRPTVFLRKEGGRLRQLVRLKVANSGEPTTATVGAHIASRACGGELLRPTQLRLPAGSSTHELYADEITEQTRVEFRLESGGLLCDRKEVAWRPPRHWTVHVVQRSHHDVGYTNLASSVLREHDEFLDRAIDMAAATSDFPEESQFRIVVEQSWSLDHYLRHAPPERAARMATLMRSGHVEVTALFGNVTTELCGSETLARLVYPSFRLRRRFGIPIVSAEHNDITGISWGLSQVLVETGIKLFCPGIPMYYSWGRNDLASFWDHRAIFGADIPGAFWWEAPSGGRVLFWAGHFCGGTCRPDLPGLADGLADLEVRGYPYSVLRYAVGGGARDNPPYIEGYAHTIRAWNEQWAYPRLVCSTNARFYDDLVHELPADLPVFRGELPGQDYPVGSTSTAKATAINRNNHSCLPSAEKLATVASFATDYSYQRSQLSAAHEDVLWHDEHTWGHHFPCGPTAEASELEKAVHAYRAAALAHDVANKALARIADRIALDNADFHLVVFNPLAHTRTGPVSAPMRELDNCGSTMAEVRDPSGVRYLRGVLLTDRWHANPPQELIEGRFDLIEVATGKNIPFQLTQIRCADETVPYAAQRLGIGSGGERYGFFELPSGLQLDLRFIAEDVPGCGYKTYRLKPWSSPQAAPKPVEGTPQSREDVPPSAEHAGTGAEALGTGSPRSGERDDALFIENEFYRVEVERRSGAIVSIRDKEFGCELVDGQAPHPFGSLIVRDPELREKVGLEGVAVSKGESGPVCVSLEITGRTLAHPSVRQTVRLYRGLKRIEFAARILKDETPLLSVHIAFPFAAAGPPPLFRYEGSLSVMEPIRDYLPGSYSDNIAVQNWVRINCHTSYAVLWSSLDAPIVSLGGLWPGYVSPAHACVVRKNLAHPPLRPEDLKKGWIYSNIFHNNFGTNFAVTQAGSTLFRYVFASHDKLSDDQAARFGWEAVAPFERIFTERQKGASQPASAGGLSCLPVAESLVQIDDEAVVLSTCKRAEDGRGVIVRLWNVGAERRRVTVRLRFLKIAAASLATLAEEDTGQPVEHDADSITLLVAGKSLATVRIVEAGDCPASREESS